MPDSFSSGVAVATEQNKQNPFNAILSSFQSAQARRYKEDAERKKEEAELSKALMVLQYKDNYDRELAKETEAEKRKSGLLEQQTKGVVTEVQPGEPGAFEGTPFGMAGKNFKATSPFNVTGQEQVPEGYEITGYDQRGQPMIRKIKVNIAEQKFNIEQADKEKQKQEKSDFVKSSAMDTLNTIQEVEKGISNFGFFGSIPSVPGTQRKNWEANVDKLLSSKVINLMTSMKEASKTGATGFGQLSEKELKVLQDASTALKRNLSPKDAQKYLDGMKSATQKILNKQQGAQGNDPEYQRFLQSIGQ